jgi:peroxiredoxin
MVDSPMSIVLSSSNRNRVGSMGRVRCSCSRPIRAWAQIGASIGKMTFLSISTTLPFSLHWVMTSLGPLNILTSSSRSLEIVGALNDLTLQSRQSLSS